MNEYAVQLLTDLLEIYSPSGKEDEVSVFLADEMRKLGFNVRIDDVGNVIGEVGRGKAHILLCGHMDTVPGYIPVRIVGNDLYGRGSVDAKASLAAMVVAGHMLAKDNLACKILVVGVVDEEGSSRGVKHLVEKRIPADYAVFGEPSGVDKVTIGYKGSLRLKITCKTQTGHSAAPWLFENAIEKVFEVWRETKKLCCPQERLESPFHSVTSCLTKINGGETSSVVPSTCHIHVDIRVPPQFTCQQVFDKVSGLVKKYQTANPKVSVKIEAKSLTDPFELNKSSTVVRAFSWAIRKVRAKPPVLLRKTGTGDMNVLGRAMKIPVVTYGPGDSRLDHTPNEHIKIREYLNAIQVYREAVIKLCELHKKAITSARSLSP